MNISKIVIPAAGFGSRFLPFTKSVPKEMLPLINKPALQEVIEEGKKSGIDHFCLIVNEDKKAIQDYFSRNGNVEKALTRHKKQTALSSLNMLIDTAQFEYIMQPEMRGLGDAILMAEQSIGDNWFGVILPDDIVAADEPCMKQMLEVAQKEQAMIIAVMEVPHEEISAYGSIKMGTRISDDLVEIVDVIEKPQPDEAFSDLAIIGRYIFSPAIFNAIRAITPQSKGEIQLTDAITYCAQNGHKILAYTFKGKRFDLGRPPGWLAANLYYGLQSPDYGEQIRKLLKTNA